MTSADYTQLMGYLVGAFGIGMASGYLLAFFHRAMQAVSSD